MTDIVERLRDWSEWDEGKINDVREVAADEIERLRATLHYIANDYVELSHDKVQWQRDDHMKMARKALAESYKDETVEPKPLDDNF
jgi:hypothetical protein